jgi:NAD(P)H-binding
VVSFLGPTSLRTTVPPTFFTDAYKFIFDAMREHHVSRILAIGTPYMPDARDPGGFKAVAAKTFMRIIASGVVATFLAINEVFDAEKELDWTVVRVARLIDAKKGVQVGLVADEKFTGSTSRDGAAQWIAELVGGEGSYIREKPMLSS